jgi:predicted nucleic acid-binding protein
MRQAAWLLDIQIAATAFASGLHVVTTNRADFEDIAELLTGLFPTSPPLQVAAGPA